MIKTVTEYKEYFEALAAAKGLSFVWGGSERILNRQNMDITYPCLWVGIPEIKRDRSGGLKKIFDGWMIVITDAPVDDYALQDEILDAMEAKTEELLVQMQHDGIYQQMFEFEIEDTTSYHRARQTADDAWGWFTEFKLRVMARQNLNC